MLHYDVFYRGASFDPARPLPDAGPGIRYAACVNGAAHTLRPIRVGRRWEWTESDPVRLDLAGPSGAAVSPEGNRQTVAFLRSLPLVASERFNGWGRVAHLTLRAEDVEAARRAVESVPGWRLVDVQ